MTPGVPLMVPVEELILNPAGKSGETVHVALSPVFVAETETVT